MAQRLPIPGGDDGTWGNILNSFLEVSLNGDGTLQTTAISSAGGEVTSNKGQASGYASLNGSGLVPSTELGSGSASSSNFLRGDGTWVVPNSGSSTLAADTDVAVVSPISNQVLTYNSGAGKWENLAPAVASVEGMTGAVTGLLLSSNNLSDVIDTGSSRANVHVPALTPAAAVATASVSSLAGFQTIDGYTLASGDLVLLTAQSTPTQNGLWSAASGPWTRPTEFATGLNIKGRTCAVLNGTSYGGSQWVLESPTSGVTVDASSQTWAQAGVKSWQPVGNYVESQTGSAVNLYESSTIPTGTNIGDLWVNTAGITLDTIPEPVNTVQMNGQRLTGLPTSSPPTASSDALSYEQGLALISAPLTIVPTSASTKGVVIEAAASQSADLQEWQNSSGVSMAYINSGGILYLGVAGSAGNAAVRALASGDTNTRYVLNNDGSMYWGPGNAAADVHLDRSAADTLQVAGNLAVTGSISGSGLSPSYKTPSDLSLIGYTVPPETVYTGFGITAETLYLFRVRATVSGTIGHIVVPVDVAGASLSGTYVGLYDIGVAAANTYTLLGSSTDFSSTFMSDAGGYATIALTVQSGQSLAVTAGTCYMVGFVVASWATTQPQLCAPGGNIGSALNMNCSAAGMTLWSATAGTTVTTLPTTIANTTASANSHVALFGIES
jgi:hypothetical protein